MRVAVEATWCDGWHNPAGRGARRRSQLPAEVSDHLVAGAGGKVIVGIRLDVQSEARERAEQKIWIDARSIHLFDPETGASLVQRPR
ncbi:hypothetical protein [Iamia sp.]|uniref:hypothetical protein n=1 Tax=Iamia sp. TaxID=2722710 RepID=UPI002CA8FAA7|nr:hypothetical protein [Iamia sp.]HXH56435.1 hypothetical protein [Iamia sp.]